MSFIDKIFGRTKQVQTQSQFLNVQPVRPDWSMNDYYEEGYKQNIIAFRCVNLISDCFAEIPFILYQKKGSKKIEIESHELIDLLNSPNKLMGQDTFLKYVASYYLLQGNSYLYGVEGTKKKPVELMVFRPDEMSIVPGNFMLPHAYKKKKGHIETTYPVDQLTGASHIMHWKSFNPNNDWYGMSIIEAAAMSIDQMNSGNAWNIGMLRNSARPSGVFSTQSTLNKDQRIELKNGIDESYTGSANTGRPMLLEAGLSWQEMSISPKDMDFIENKKFTSRDIATAFNVPSQLVGVQGDSTYANYEQAVMAFYLQTVIPLRKNFTSNLSRWLTPIYGTDLEICDDTDTLEALAPLREKKWNSAQNAGWLTINEKRALTGYGDYQKTNDPANMIFVPMGQTPLDYMGEEPEDEDEQDTSDYQEDESETEETPEENEEGKAVNLNSPRQRQIYQRNHLAKRQGFERSFRKQMEMHFYREKKLVMQNLDGVSPNMAQYVMIKTIKDNESTLFNIMKNNIESIMKSFGSDVLNLGKSRLGLMQFKEVDEEFNEVVSDYIEKETAKRVKNISKTTEKKLKKVIKNSLTGNEDESIVNIQKAIEDSYNGFSKPRAATIAATETHSASVMAGKEAAESLGVEGMTKTWVSDLSATARGMNPNDAVSHVALDGETIGIDEKFEIPTKDGIDYLDAPGDPDAGGHQIINCKCVLVYNVPEGE